MDPRIKKLQKLADHDKAAAMLVSLANEGGAATEGLAEVLPTLLPIGHVELRGAVLFAYCRCFPAEAIGVLREQVGRVTHPGMLDTIAGLVLDHAIALKACAGSETLATLLLEKRSSLTDARVRWRFTDAAASIAPAPQAAALLTEVAREPGELADVAAIRLCELGRADLAAGCSLDRVAPALESNDPMKRGLALELVAKLGAHAQPLLPSLHLLANRLGLDTHGLRKALEAVQGSAEVPATSLSFDLQRVRSIAGGAPSWDAWSELMRLLRAAPEDLDPEPIIAELEVLLAKWPVQYREAEKNADLSRADRWGALVRSVVVARRGWTASDVEKLVAASAFPNLVSLTLDDNQIGDEGVEHLLQAPWIGQLQKLAVVSDRLTDATASAIARAPLASLKTLDLRSNRLTGEGARKLSASGTLHLTNLELGLEEEDPL